MSVPADASWKAELELPNDAFFSAPQGDFLEELRWVKFIVLAKDPGKVYFQNTATAPFHYEFASAQIPAFEGMTRAQFDAVTLENEGRQAILGAVLIPADSYDTREYGVQIVSQDDLPPELVDTVMQAVAAHITAPSALQAHYFRRGPMGYGMGLLQVITHDGKGVLTIEPRPFVVMVDQAYVDLGVVE